MKPSIVPLIVLGVLALLAILSIPFWATSKELYTRYDHSFLPPPSVNYHPDPAKFVMEFMTMPGEMERHLLFICNGDTCEITLTKSGNGFASRGTGTCSFQGEQSGNLRNILISILGPNNGSYWGKQGTIS